MRIIRLSGIVAAVVVVVIAVVLWFGGPVRDCVAAYNRQGYAEAPSCLSCTSFENLLLTKPMR
jgi:hypothetical protein